MPNLRELPDVLRRAGVPVRTWAGWETRTISGTFRPKAVVWHHDASAVGDSPGVPAYMVGNYPKAGAQLWVDRYGTWTVLSCQKAAHAGKVLPGMPGNAESYGVETDHTTGEAWPAAQLDSLRRGTAALLAWLGTNAAAGLHFHRTVCSPVGRKSDPAGLDLAAERRAVAGVTTLSAPASTTLEEDDLFTDADRANLVAVLQQLGRNPQTGKWEGWPQTDGLTLLDAVADVRHVLRDPIRSGVAGSTVEMTPRETWRNADAYGNRVERLVAAQAGAIDALTKALAAGHDQVDTDAVVTAVQSAIAAAVVKVDVSVAGPEPTKEITQ